MKCIHETQVKRRGSVGGVVVSSTQSLEKVSATLVLYDQNQIQNRNLEITITDIIQNAIVLSDCALCTNNLFEYSLFQWTKRVSFGKVFCDIPETIP